MTTATLTRTTDSHTGPVVLRWHKNWLSVQCPYGHAVTHQMLDETWGGSWLEAKVASHQHHGDWIVTCDGALPTQEGTDR